MRKLYQVDPSPSEELDNTLARHNLEGMNPYCVCNSFKRRADDVQYGKPSARLRQHTESLYILVNFSPKSATRKS